MRDTVGMTDVIDGYVAAVGRVLRGPRRLRADMLAEIRDALVDAAEGHLQGGAAAGEAARVAVDEFGPVSGVAAGLQRVLAVAQARRTAWWLLGVLGAHFAVTWYVGHSGQWGRVWPDAPPPGAGYVALAAATNVFVVGVLLAAGIAVGWGLRRSGGRRPVVRWTGGLAAAAVGVAVVATLVLTLLAPGVRLTAGVVWAALTAVVPFMPVLLSAWRCWRVAGALAAPPARPVSR